jgi:hypothetical protein
MVVKSETTRPMVVCYPPDNVPMIEDPKRPGEFKPDVTWLITEDDTPVDGILSERQMRLLADPLTSSWVDSDGKKKQFVVMVNVGLFHSASEPPVLPDMLLSMGVSLPENVSIKQKSCYFFWEYDNKAPDVVFEIVSNREGGEDTRKLELYARIGVPWYVIFDPQHHLSADDLRVYRHVRKKYRLVKERFFPEVGLGITLWEGRNIDLYDRWLRWCYADGTLLPTGEEQRERADSLAAKLRARGIDPSSAP